MNPSNNLHPIRNEFVKEQRHSFQLRAESFGATVYSPETLSYYFINHPQVGRLARAKHLNLPCRTVGPAEEPVTTDWSRGQFESLLNPGCRVEIRELPMAPPTHTLAAPVRVYFELTTLCDLRCDYCLNNSGPPRPNALSTEEILKTVGNLHRDGVFEVRLTGGEVTLLGDFQPIAHAVQDTGMCLSINSNLRGSARVMEQLEELRPSLLITSLDAHKDAHRRARGEGYGRIVSNIRRLRGVGVPVRINCALNLLTLSHLGSFIDRFAAIGCGFCFILLRPVGRAKGGFAPAPLDDLLNAVDLINSKKSDYPDCYFSTSFHVVMEEELIVGGINLTGCNAIQKSFNINSDGSVLPCAFLYELSKETFSLGNIRNTDYSVLPIWRESTLLRRLHEQSAACNQRCIECSHFKCDCLGSCVFMDLYTRQTGNPDPYCRISAESGTPFCASCG